MIEGWVEERDGYKRVKAPLGGLLEMEIWEKDNNTFSGEIYEDNSCTTIFKVNNIEKLEECAKIMEDWYFKLIETEYTELLKRR